MGRMLWADLTVDNADAVSDFYATVVGWEKQGLDMGGYDDYVMKETESGEGISGVCHARGANSNIPPQWLLYVTVPDLDKSLEDCLKLGGKMIGDKRKMGPNGTYCLIQDPAGAYMMLCGE
ncbi:MAG: VOC family protein [Sphingobacteriales bacterium]|nr:MAG: VOC family protein [Sphingobacteriales bacterium]